jgi:hypothetical protein
MEFSELPKDVPYEVEFGNRHDDLQRAISQANRRVDSMREGIVASQEEVEESSQEMRSTMTVQRSEINSIISSLKTKADGESLRSQSSEIQANSTSQQTSNVQNIANSIIATANIGSAASAANSLSQQATNRLPPIQAQLVGIYETRDSLLDTVSAQASQQSTMEIELDWLQETIYYYH